MKKFQSIGFLLSAITGLSMLLLVFVFSLAARDAFNNRQIAAERLADLDGVQDLMRARDLLRLTQGKVSTALEAPAADDAYALKRIQDIQPRLRAMLDAAMRKPQRHPELGFTLPSLVAARAAYETSSAEVLDALRHGSGKSRVSLDMENVQTRGALAAVLEREAAILASNIDTADPFMSQIMKIARMAWKVREDAGTGRHIIADIAVAGTKPSSQQLAQIAEVDGRIASPWGVIAGDVTLPIVPVAVKNAAARTDRVYFGHYRAARQKLIAQLGGEGPKISAQQWLAQTDRDLDSITAVADTALDQARLHISAQLAMAVKKSYIAIGFLIFSVFLAALMIMVVVFRVVRPLRRMARTMRMVAKGELDGAIPFQQRGDEIGEFARALTTFRGHARERHQMEIELLHNQIARDSAEASNRIKTEFLANMSHELRTPLNAVIGFSDMMRQKIFGPLSPQYEDYAGMIHESGQLLLNLVSDILDVAKIEAGKFTLDLQKVNLTEVVDSCIRLMKKRADDNHITLRTQLPATQIQFVADPRALKQILLNLLSNSVKFAQQGGWVEVAAETVGQMLKITVRDNGIGIPANALQRIGHAFEQASNDPTRSREGTGLGLALVRALADQHGGSLTIASTEHIGTTVTVLLPLSQEARKAA